MVAGAKTANNKRMAVPGSKQPFTQMPAALVVAASCPLRSGGVLSQGLKAPSTRSTALRRYYRRALRHAQTLNRSLAMDLALQIHDHSSQSFSVQVDSTDIFCGNTMQHAASLWYWFWTCATQHMSPTKDNLVTGRPSY